MSRKPKTPPQRWRVIHDTCGECVGTVGSIYVPITSEAAEFISADGFRESPGARRCKTCRRWIGEDFSVRRA